MKRYAILLGNTNGLNGVQKDILSFKHFLMEDKGGCWYDKEEILLKENISLSELRHYLSRIKELKFDYVIFYFSGHGGLERTTEIELNAEYETISETELFNLAPRQLTIFDCCRCYPEVITESVIKSHCNFSALEKSMIEPVRQRYAERIMQAVPQQMVLYACKKGEYSQDSEDGGVYTKNLLYAANNVNSDFKTVLEAHSEASVYVPGETDDTQHPSYRMTKVPPEKQLVLSMSNKYFRGDYF